MCGCQQKMDSFKLRVQSQYLLKLPRRLFHFLLIRVNQAQVVVSFEEVRFYFQRLAKERGLLVAVFLRCPNQCLPLLEPALGLTPDLRVILCAEFLALRISGGGEDKSEKQCYQGAAVAPVKVWRPLEVRGMPGECLQQDVVQWCAIPKQEARPLKSP